MGVGFPVRVTSQSSAPDCAAGEILTAIDDAFAEITGRATPVTGVEVVQVRQSLGRELATKRRHANGAATSRPREDGAVHRRTARPAHPPGSAAASAGTTPPGGGHPSAAPLRRVIR